MTRILILGGTRDAVVLAEMLVAAGYEVITSLAGVTSSPVAPKGRLRIGGFGGVEGLAAYLKAEGIAALIDATHPFAEQISRHGVEAASAMGVPLLRLERKAWAFESHWIEVADVRDAVAALPAGARALVTIGRQEIAPFLARPGISGVARMIEPPDTTVPETWRLLLQRPPFTVEAERTLMETAQITHLVSKNAGGRQTEAKLVAAREKNLPVIMIARPAKPAAPTFGDAEHLQAALRRLVSP